MPDYTGIFEVFGVFARTFAQFRNLADRNLYFTGGGETCRSLDRLRQEFVAVLNDLPEERDRLDAATLLGDAAQTVRAWTNQLDHSLDAWIRGGLASQLGVASLSRAGVLAALARDMVADAQSVQANAVSAGAVSAASGNVGDAPCYVSAKSVSPAEALVDDERILSQSIEISCTRDAAHHRLDPGKEEFSISPEVGPPASLRVIPVAVGDAPDTRNVISDGAFENETGGVFDYWIVQAGGSALSREQAVYLFGTGSLKVAGDGATAADLRQDLAGRDPVMPSGRMYALGAWVYVSSLTAGTVSIDLLVDGSPSTLSLVVDGSTPTAQWVHLGGFEYLPRTTFPNKVAARIQCGATFNGVVYIDGVSLAPATEIPHAGIQAAVFQGGVAPQALPMPDRYTFSTTSDDAGAFQSFFRDRLGVALPSSGTPTISDSLAE